MVIIDGMAHRNTNSLGDSFANTSEFILNLLIEASNIRLVCRNILRGDVKKDTIYNQGFQRTS